MTTPPVNQSTSCNALTEEDYQRLDRIIVNRAGFGGWNPLHAMLAVEVAKRGHRLIPPMFPGGHTTIVMATGERVSLAAYLEMLRVQVLLSAQCQECGERLLANAQHGTRRGPRTDRHYCSPACRQRAYRKRKQAP